MNVRKPRGLALIVAVAAMATMAFAASSASATEVVPASKEIKGTLQEKTHSKFFLDNGYSTAFVSCQKSEVVFTTPQAGKLDQWANTNKPNTSPTKKVGGGEESETHSQAQGSVSSQVKSVSFAECTARTSEEQGNQGVEIGAATVEVFNPTHWTIAGEFVATGVNPQLAVGVPQYRAEGGKGVAGVTIKIPALKCELHIGEDQKGANQQTVVMGSLNNTTHKATLDGQVKYRAFKTEQLAPEGVCKEIDELPAPAQFEAEYNLTENFEIK